MKRRPKIFYTEADKALMWDRWQKGDSMNEIARGLVAIIRLFNVF